MSSYRGGGGGGHYGNNNRHHPYRGRGRGKGRGGYRSSGDGVERNHHHLRHVHDPVRETRERLTSMLVLVGDRGADLAANLEGLVSAVSGDVSTHGGLLSELLVSCAVELPFKSRLYAVLVALVNVSMFEFCDGVVAEAVARVEKGVTEGEEVTARNALRFLCDLVEVGVVAPASLVKLFSGIASEIAECMGGTGSAAMREQQQQQQGLGGANNMDYDVVDFDDVEEHTVRKRSPHAAVIGDYLCSLLIHGLVWSAATLTEKGKVDELSALSDTVADWISARPTVRPCAAIVPFPGEPKEGQEPFGDDVDPLSLAVGSESDRARLSDAARGHRDELDHLHGVYLEWRREGYPALRVLPTPHDHPSIREKLGRGGDMHLVPTLKLARCVLRATEGDPPGTPSSDGIRAGNGLPIPGHAQWVSCPASEVVRSLRPVEAEILMSHATDVAVLHRFDREEVAMRLAGLTSVISRPGSQQQQQANGSDAVSQQQGDAGNSTPPIHAPLVIEALLRLLLTPPGPVVPANYITALIADLCRAHPAVPSSLFRAVNRIFDAVGTMDPAVAGVFSDWFAGHLAQFGYLWPWGEWNKRGGGGVRRACERRFVRDVIAKCAEHAYGERVAKALPEEMRDLVPPEPCKVVLDPPAVTKENGGGGNLNGLHGVVLQLLRERKDAAEVQKAIVSAVSSGGVDAASAASMLSKLLLLAGHRALSNMIRTQETYAPVVRALEAMEGVGKWAKYALPDVAAFWKTSPLRLAVTVERMVMVRTVEPSDVLEWCFTVLSSPSSPSGDEGSDTHIWDVLTRVVDVVKSRTAVTRADLDEATAAVEAGDRTAPDRARLARAALDTMLEEEKALFLGMFQRFAVLTSADGALGSGGGGRSQRAQVLFRMLQFGRLYRCEIEPFIGTLSSFVFSKDAAQEDARMMFEKIRRLL